MVQNCNQWRHGEKVLALKEEAVEEAQMALARLREGVEMVPGLTEDIIKMSEYLGIRVLSEPSLLWIAADAFSAPLPTGWTTHRDTSGRMFFHNSTSNASQWDHPLDGHFRRLRDKHREELAETCLDDCSRAVRLETDIAARSDSSVPLLLAPCTFVRHAR